MSGRKAGSAARRWWRERKRMGWDAGDIARREGEREREREICKLHKFVVERRRPQGEIQHDARAAECLGRSLGRSVGPSLGRPATNRAFNVASLFVPPFPRSPSCLFPPPSLLPSFPPSLPLPSVVCCRSIGEEHAHWSVAVVGRPDGQTSGRCFVRRPFRDLGFGQFFPRPRPMSECRRGGHLRDQQGCLAFPIEANASERPRKQPASTTRKRT